MADYNAGWIRANEDAEREPQIRRETLKVLTMPPKSLLSLQALHNSFS